MTARASSIYSLRFYPKDARSAAYYLDCLTAGLAHIGTPRQDSHVRLEDGRRYAAVGFRAADPGEARRIAEQVLDHPKLDPARAQLFTGFGSSRREVAL